MPWLLGALLVMLGCKPVRIVHRTNLTQSSSRDTIIKQSKMTLKDTIIMHIAASAPDSCLKIPKPPGCPEYVTAMSIDTIPRPKR
jgi:hypothetical protein